MRSLLFYFVSNCSSQLDSHKPSIFLQPSSRSVVQADKDMLALVLLAFGMEGHPSISQTNPNCYGDVVSHTIIFLCVRILLPANLNCCPLKFVVAECGLWLHSFTVGLCILSSLSVRLLCESLCRSSIMFWCELYFPHVRRIGANYGTM